MDISQLIYDITWWHGWISGSYVRDVLIRKDPNYVLRDLDVLIPFHLHKMLIKILTDKYNFVQEVIDYSFDDKVAHTET